MASQSRHLNELLVPGRGVADLETFKRMLSLVQSYKTEFQHKTGPNLAREKPRREQDEIVKYEKAVIFDDRNTVACECYDKLQFTLFLLRKHARRLLASSLAFPRTKLSDLLTSDEITPNLRPEERDAYKDAIRDMVETQFANLCREMRLLITERPIDISEPGVVESAGWQYMQSLKLPMLNDNEQQFIKQRRHLASSNAVQNLSTLERHHAANNPALRYFSQSQSLIAQYIRNHQMAPNKGKEMQAALLLKTPILLPEDILRQMTAVDARLAL